MPSRDLADSTTSFKFKSGIAYDVALEFESSETVQENNTLYQQNYAQSYSSDYSEEIAFSFSVSRSYSATCHLTLNAFNFQFASPLP